MYKLIVISGPNRGSTYPFSDGEVSIGRQGGNTITLSSSKISKRHCTITLRGDVAQLKDEGSSNGTFVNGVLVKSKKLEVGDRIGVGEYVLELARSGRSTAPAPIPLEGFGQQAMQFPGSSMPGMSGTPGGGVSSAGLAGMGGQTGGMMDGSAPLSASNAPPKDLLGKVSWFFENDFMKIFYEFNLKYEWRAITVFLFAVFVIGNVLVSVYPLLESSRSTIIKETERRALFMAKQIAEKNVPYLAAKAETKTEIGSSANGEGVRVAVLTDLDSRILAPAEKMNQYLTSGPEAIVAVKARDLFRNGRETGLALEGDDVTVVAVEPVKVLNPAVGKNIIVGMAIVSIDSSQFTLDLGEMGLVYSQSTIITGILALLVLLILHRLTMKPFLTLNEDLDKVLKGDISQVSHDYKISELNSLWEIINAAIQRIPKAGASGDSMGGSGVTVSVDEYAGPLKALGDLAKVGIAVFDGEQKIAIINGAFEEITGIRGDNATGHTISEVARDQAMIAFTADILGRAPAGNEGLVEDFEISGVGYRVYACAFGQSGMPVRCYLLAITKSEEG